MDALQLTGTFSVTEAEEAYALSRSRWSRLKDLVGLYVLCGMIVVPLVVAVWELMSSSETMLVAPALVTAFLAMAGLAATVAKKKMDRTKLETMRNNQQGLFVPATWTLTDAGPIVVSEIGTSEVKWGAFRGCRIGTNAMILFQTQPRRNYNILGRSQAANDDVWNAAIAIVSEKLTHV